MRYTNWDVLLFPDGSKVPMQEFKTACYAVHDAEYFSQDMTTASNGPFEHAPSRQVPTVTCFVANLSGGTPFRVSLYSWEPPSISSESAQSTTLGINKVCFEARVFIDETCVSGLLFNEQGLWPQVIDKSSYVDKAGNRDCLRFPHFRPEILTQSFWNAGEKVGRIRVVISEGFPPASSNLPFIRLKNLVSFSFQHAPLHVLENSGIAWPNPGMWYQPCHPYYNWASPTKTETAADTELHAHSPRRTENLTGGIGEKMETDGQPLSNFYIPMPPPPAPRPGCEGENPMWRSMTSIQDPFMNGANSMHRARFMHNRYAARSSIEDQLMPDYSRSITPTSGRNEGDPPANHGRTLNAQPNNNQSFEDIMNQLNPHSEGTNGVTAPANTRVSSAANTPPLQTRPSAAAEARAASYPLERVRAVSMIMKDPLTLADDNRETVMKSYLQGDQTFTFSGDPISSRLPRGPAGEIKSKKEGNVSELEVPRQMRKRSSNGSIDPKDKENSKTTFTTTIESSDGKRKRASTSTGSQTGVHEAEVMIASPRKVSKKKVPKDQVERAERVERVEKVERPLDDAGSLRAPLESLDNV